jgi:chemotaxis protein CheZ
MITINSNTPIEESLVPNDLILNRIGQLTRTLHESLRSLGLDKILEQVAIEIPDARDRLNYVAQMTEQAAERVLNSIDLANPLQDEIANEGIQLEVEWRKFIDESDLNAYNLALVNKTISFIEVSTRNSLATKALLIDIMMAQDFQDLTGQVIKKISLLAHDLELELGRVLTDFSPATSIKDTGTKLLNGHQISPDKDVNALSSQAQVDSLLDTLGF